MYVTAKQETRKQPRVLAGVPVERYPRCGVELNTSNTSFLHAYMSVFSVLSGVYMTGQDRTGQDRTGLTLLLVWASRLSFSNDDADAGATGESTGVDAL